MTMGLEFKKVVEDPRGKILFMSYDGKKSLNIAEIKKGFARGGHYHPYEQYHVILSGKIEYREENLDTKKEQIHIIKGPEIIQVPPNTAHLLIALEDTLFFESFAQNYVATDYPKYRKIVKERMKS